MERKDRDAQTLLPWVEKYRPDSLADLISHKDIIDTINKFIEKGQMPHLLFYGPPGTGKTSTILACAKKLFGKHWKSMTLELNASDDRGISVVREQIKDFASTRKIFSSGFKLVILDEADAMTKVAQAALRRVMEKYTKNTRFCMICNYVSNIIPALQSRCMRFRFAPLQREQIDARLSFIITSENVNVTEEGKKALLRLSSGDMRKCLNILQATYMAYGSITEESVYLCTGSPQPKDIETMVKWLLGESFAEAFGRIMQLKTEKGLALADIVREIHPYVVRIEFSPRVKSYVVERLSEIEHRLALATREKLQLGALVGTFQLAKKMVEAEAGAATPGV